MFKSPRTVLIGVILIVIIGLFIYKVFVKEGALTIKERDYNAIEAVKSENNSKGSSLPLPKLTQRQMDKIALLQEQGLISFDLSSHKVYIKPAFWAPMDPKLKEDMTVAFAVYCAIKNHKDVIDIEVFDKQSNQKIAEYNQLFGYKLL